MSKSLGNYIGIDEPPNEMYGKVMSIPDNLIVNYFELLTDETDEQLAAMSRSMAEESMNPMELKKRLATNIVTQFHDHQASLVAANHFQNIYQSRNLPTDMFELEFHFTAPLQGPNNDILKIMPRDDNKVDSLNDASTSQTIVDIPSLLLRSGIVTSRGEAKRLITQKAIELNGIKVAKETVLLRSTPNQVAAEPILSPGDVIRIGRHKFLRIMNSGS